MNLRSKNLPLILAAIPSLLILGILLFGLRGIAFTFIEFPLFAQPTVLIAGLNPSWNDFKLAFDWMGLDGFERPRFLSNLIQTGTVRLRWFLYEIGISHASLGLQWFFALIGVIFGSLAARRLLGPDAIVPTALALLTSVGFLSHILMLFHPAKAIAFATSAATLWLATRATERPWQTGAFAGLLAIIGLSGDETALLGILLPVVLVPGLATRRTIGYWLAQIPFGIAFLVWILWGAPIAVAGAGQPPFDILNAMTRYTETNISRSPTSLSDLPVMIGSNLFTFLAHAVSPLSDLAVAVLEVPGAREPALVMTLDSLYPISPIHGSPLLLLLLGAGPVLILLAGIVWLSWQQREAWAIRCLAGVSICAILLAMMMRVPASGQFYYGSIAALPIALLLAWLWTRTTPGPLLGGIAALWVSLTGIANATYQTAQWQTWGQEKPTVHIGSWPTDPQDRPKWLQAEDRIAERLDRGRTLAAQAATDPALTGIRVGVVFRAQDLFERPTFLTEIDNRFRPPSCDLCILPPNLEGDLAPATLWRGQMPSGSWAETLFLFDCREGAEHATSCRNPLRDIPPPQRSWLPDRGQSLRKLFQARAQAKYQNCQDTRNIENHISPPHCPTRQ